jgi:hypothetical protein
VPPLGSAPPCKLEHGWKFQGIVRYYPHVEPAPAPKKRDAGQPTGIASPAPSIAGSASGIS